MLVRKKYIFLEPFWSVHTNIGISIYKFIHFVGGAIYIHAFGAYFGLAVSMMSRKRDVGKSAQMEASRYSSDIFSLVSIFWFNTLTIADYIISNINHIKGDSYYIMLNFRSAPFCSGFIGQVLMPRWLREMLSIELSSTLTSRYALQLWLHSLLAPFLESKI